MEKENLDLITTALAAGLAASTEAAVKTALEALRDALRRALAGRREALEKLDQNARDAAEWRKWLGKDLVKSGAVNDPEVVRLARSLCGVAAARDASVTNQVSQRDAYGGIASIGSVEALHMTNHFPSPQPPTAS